MPCGILVDLILNAKIIRKNNIEIEYRMIDITKVVFAR
jgi:hypothetical protein